MYMISSHIFSVVPSNLKSTTKKYVEESRYSSSTVIYFSKVCYKYGNYLDYIACYIISREYNF